MSGRQPLLQHRDECPCDMCERGRQKHTDYLADLMFWVAVLATVVAGFATCVEPVRTALLGFGVATFAWGQVLLFRRMAR